MAHRSIIDNKESDMFLKVVMTPIIANSDVDINDLDKLKTKVMAFKMFITVSYIY